MIFVKSILVPRGKGGGGDYRTRPYLCCTRRRGGASIQRGDPGGPMNGGGAFARFGGCLEKALVLSSCQLGQVWVACAYCMGLEGGGAGVH